jgi:hypothetical protein
MGRWRKRIVGIRCRASRHLREARRDRLLAATKSRKKYFLHGRIFWQESNVFQSSGDEFTLDQP